MPSILKLGRLFPSLIPRLPVPRNRGVAEGAPLPKAAATTIAAAIVALAASLLGHLHRRVHRWHHRARCRRPGRGGCWRGRPDGQFLALALAVAGQRGVEVDGLLDAVLGGECRRGERREDRDVNQERHAPGRQQVTEPDRAAAAGAGASGLAKPVRDWQARHWEDCRPDSRSNCAERPTDGLAGGACRWRCAVPSGALSTRTRQIAVAWNARAADRPGPRTSSSAHH